LRVVCLLDYLSTGGNSIAKIVKVEISGGKKRITDCLGNDLAISPGREVEDMR
jgi:hypothetical protein